MLINIVETISNEINAIVALKQKYNFFLYIFVYLI